MPFACSLSAHLPQDLASLLQQPPDVPDQVHNIRIGSKTFENFDIPTGPLKAHRSSLTAFLAGPEGPNASSVVVMKDKSRLKAWNTAFAIGDDGKVDGLDLAMSKTCPDNFDNGDKTSQDTWNFVEKCLDDIDSRNEQLSEHDVDKLSNCSNRTVVTAHPARGKERFTFKTSDEGGICHAKLYKVKCEGGKLKSGCADANLYRAWTAGASKFGTYWGASDPKSMNKAPYREAYAICEGWNPDMNKITKAHLTDAACDSYIFVGNGEQVKSCPNPNETFKYSPYLQTVVCQYPQSSIMEGDEEDWA